MRDFMRRTDLASVPLDRTALALSFCPGPQYKSSAMAPRPSLSFLEIRTEQLDLLQACPFPFLQHIPPALNSSLLKSAPRARSFKMCHFSRIDRACGHFEDQEITFGKQCKTVCEKSKTNTDALARAGKCLRCRKMARQTQQPSRQLNRLKVSDIVNKLRSLRVSAQPAAPKEKPAPNPAAPKEKPAAPKPAPPGQKLPAQVAPKPSDPRPGQKPAPPSSSSGRTGQGATTGTPSTAARVVSAGTSQTRQGNRSVPAVN